jgi:hypothetical protein
MSKILPSQIALMRFRTFPLVAATNLTNAEHSRHRRGVGCAARSHAPISYRDAQVAPSIGPWSSA